MCLGRNLTAANKPSSATLPMMGYLAASCMHSDRSMPSYVHETRPDAWQSCKRIVIHDATSGFSTYCSAGCTAVQASMHAAQWGRSQQQTTSARGTQLAAVEHGTGWKAAHLLREYLCFVSLAHCSQACREDGECRCEHDIHIRIQWNGRWKNVDNC